MQLNHGSLMSRRSPSGFHKQSELCPSVPTNPDLLQVDNSFTVSKRCRVWHYDQHCSYCIQYYWVQNYKRRVFKHKNLRNYENKYVNSRPWSYLFLQPRVNRHTHTMIPEKMLLLLRKNFTKRNWNVALRREYYIYNYYKRIRTHTKYHFCSLPLFQISKGWCCRHRHTERRTT